MHEALFFSKLTDNKVKCVLCPWNCILSEGQTGNCKVRTNHNGKLTTEVYGKVAALSSDPIEKKPLYHFFPGKNILSLGEVGCNLHCSFCQNHHISQCMAKHFEGFHHISSEQIVEEALKTRNNIGLAYTYNEPFTFYEFLLDTAKHAKSQGLKNVVVSNGYINKAPLEQLLPFIDAFNIDLKAFSDEFYTSHTKGRLAPVLQTIKTIAASGSHLEITNLVITGLNDNETEFREMAKWIAEETGCDTPLHLSRYYPQYRMTNPPTPEETLHRLYEIAGKYLHHVFLGNVSDEQRSSSYCTNCGKVLVSRNHYKTKLVNLSPTGDCTSCGTLSSIKL